MRAKDTQFGGFPGGLEQVENHNRRTNLRSKTLPYLKPSSPRLSGTPLPSRGKRLPSLGLSQPTHPTGHERLSDRAPRLSTTPSLAKTTPPDPGEAPQPSSPRLALLHCHRDQQNVRNGKTARVPRNGAAGHKQGCANIPAKPRKNCPWSHFPVVPPGAEQQ